MIVEERPGILGRCSTFQIGSRNKHAGSFVGEAAAIGRGKTVGLRIAEFGEADVPFQFEAAKTIVELEVDHPGDCIRPIDRRRAAGDHLDCGNERGRHGVEVDRAGSVGRLQSASVEQDERTLRTQPAKVGIGPSARSTCNRARLRALCCLELRQRVE